MKNVKKLRNLNLRLKYLKKQIRLTIFAPLFATLIFSSCGGLPSKPSLDLCVHDQPNFKVYCSNNQTGNEYDLDINQTYRFLMFSPDHYGLLIQYIKKLELRLSPKKKGIRSELKKFIKISKKMMIKLEKD